MSIKEKLDCYVFGMTKNIKIIMQDNYKDNYVRVPNGKCFCFVLFLYYLPFVPFVEITEQRKKFRFLQNFTFQGPLSPKKCCFLMSGVSVSNVVCALPQKAIRILKRNWEKVKTL